MMIIAVAAHFQFDFDPEFPANATFKVVGQVKNEVRFYVDVDEFGS